MLIFWKERLAFLSTPKTGSTSIETALESLAQVAIRRPPELKHMMAAQFQNHMAPLLQGASGESFTTVALMRDPIDWLGSWWRYRQRDDIRDLPSSTVGISFDEAAQAYMSEGPPDYIDVGTQGRFLGYRKGMPKVDRIFRYEEIGRFVDFLEDRLGCEIILPRLNVSPKAALTLEAKTRTLLRHHLADDYRLYDSLT
ncbi:MAG: sulfotransferase family 2 domain-containing protein [Rhodobacteraceae bacterium]|nr:sulfotransferase family 2 domain-containing protein [Paracoccaceae bacterium]